MLQLFKKYNIFWINNDDRFVVYLNYKLQLKAYSKKLFDPFCRRERIYFNYNNDNENDNNEKKYLITTVGQLNFFKWMIENNIIDYIIKNYENIESDMHNTIKDECIKLINIINAENYLNQLQNIQLINNIQK